MIRLYRHLNLAGAEAGRRYTAWCTRGLRVYVVDARGLRFDAAPVRRLGPVDAPQGTSQITFQLEGTLLSRRMGRDLVVEPGTMALEPSISWNERWLGEGFRALVVEWKGPIGPVLGSTSTLRASGPELLALPRLADAIERGGAAEANAALVEIDALLRALGLTLEGFEEARRAEHRPADHRAAALLSSLRSSLAERPMWVDAELRSGLSERQLRRGVQGLMQAIGSSLPGLRALLRRERMVSAAALLTVRGVRVDQVAASVGYGSSRALALAFQAEGLPSASALIDAANAEPM